MVYSSAERGGVGNGSERFHDVRADGVHVQRLKLGERTRHGEELDNSLLLRFDHETPFARLDRVDDNRLDSSSSEKTFEFLRSSFERVSALASLHVRIQRGDAACRGRWGISEDTCVMSCRCRGCLTETY